MQYVPITNLYTYEIIANLDNPQQTDLSQNTSSTLWCFVIFWNSWFIPLIHHFLGTCGITHNLYCRQPGMCYGNSSWIYKLPICNTCLSPLMLWIRILLRRGVPNTTLCYKVCQWLATGRWFSLGTPVSSTNKTDHHDITEILWKWR
jgi:hypothetical protein